MSLDPIKPYADLLKVIAIAVVSMILVAALFMGGCAVGKGQSAGEIAALNATIAKKDRALSAAAASLGASAVALRAVNREAKRRVAAADQAKEQARLAGMVAANAQAIADKRMAAFDREIERARQNPTCDTLLLTNVRSVCGF